MARKTPGEAQHRRERPKKLVGTGPGDVEAGGSTSRAALECVQENPIKTIVRLVYAWRDLQQQGLHHCYNEREERYLIVTCIVITDVPEALGPLPVAVMAKASLPLYLAFAVYW